MRRPGVATRMSRRARAGGSGSGTARRRRCRRHWRAGPARSASPGRRPAAASSRVGASTRTRGAQTPRRAPAGARPAVASCCSAGSTKAAVCRSGLRRPDQVAPGQQRRNRLRLDRRRFLVAAGGERGEQRRGEIEFFEFMFVPFITGQAVRARRPFGAKRARPGPAHARRRRCRENPEGKEWERRCQPAPETAAPSGGWHRARANSRNRVDRLQSHRR